MQKTAALRASVFSLFAKNLRGGWRLDAPPSARRGLSLAFALPRPFLGNMSVPLTAWALSGLTSVFRPGADDFSSGRGSSCLKWDMYVHFRICKNFFRLDMGPAQPVMGPLVLTWTLLGIVRVLTTGLSPLRPCSCPHGWPGPYQAYMSIRRPDVGFSDLACP